MTINKTHFPSRGCEDLSRECGRKSQLRLINTDLNHVFYTSSYNGNKRKSWV